MLLSSPCSHRSVSPLPLPGRPIWRLSAAPVPPPVFPQSLLAIPQTHILQGTCPDCVREESRQNNISVCCDKQSPLSSSFSSSTRTLPSLTSMDESSSNTPRQDRSTTRISTTPELSSPTEKSPDYSGTETGHRSSTSPQPDPSSSPDSFSSYIPLTTANPSLETSAGPFTTKPGKSLNVTAIGIGIAGAALLLIVCVSMIFYLRKKKQKKRVPPSAEFMDVAVIWRPRAYHEMISPTSLTFTPKGDTPLASSLEPLRYKPPISHYSSPPSTPPWSS